MNRNTIICMLLAASNIPLLIFLALDGEYKKTIPAIVSFIFCSCMAWSCRTKR